MFTGRAQVLALAMLATSGFVAQAQTQPWPSDAPKELWDPTPGQECAHEFREYQQEVETRAKAVKAASEQKAARAEICRLLTDYSTAEAAWLRSVDDMARCGLYKERIEQIRNAHLRTAQANKRLCAPELYDPEDGAARRGIYLRISER